MMQLDALARPPDGFVRSWIISGWCGIGIHMANYDNGDRSLAQASVKGTVKWFNATKGYGFITLENGGDAFCHASALAALGTPNLPQGATIVCDLQESPRGLQVVTVHTVDTSTADQAPSSRGPRREGGPRGGGFGGGFGDRDRGFGGGGYGGGGGYRDRDAGPSGPMVEGKVKFFNDQKGFGFVMPDGGGGDVYVHASALRRSGIAVLEPEQRVRFSTRQGMKGVEVDRVEVI
jgi:CspA family cold shock protein